jgi:3-dehydroquinate synthetase/mannose-6-phosphate isomerase-like protein (cupin superfamily)
MNQMNKLFTRLVEAPAIRREREHGGAGPIQFRRLWNSTDFAAPIDFIDFTIIPSGSRIGRHGHEGNEEAYFVVSGSPLMRVENEERRLGKGDVSVVHSGQTHELINDTPDDVEIFVIQVRMSGETATVGAENRFQPGVQYTNADENSVLHMRATRPVHYRVVHPVKPVFDLDESALADFVQARPVLLVVDANVYKLFGEQIDSYFKQRLHSVGKVLIDADGRRKEWPQVERVCEAAVRHSLPRHGLIVGVGGGTTLDMAGMAASLFRRGVGYLRIPTTLVGIVDVGVGVKQGINFGKNKNILGAFYPPVGAMNDLRFLQTLSQQEISCGIAEIIKLGVVCNSGLFELLEAHGPRLLSSRFQAPAKAAYEVAIRAEELMMQQLQPNLFDEEMCRLVDFGHTFSPSIETASNYRIPHGEAVAVDMLMSTIIAVERGICDPDVLIRLMRLYQAVSLPMTQCVCSAKDFLESIRQTRLHRGGNLNLVVPTRIGSACFIQNVQAAELERVITRCSGDLTAGGAKALYASAGV